MATLFQEEDTQHSLRIGDTVLLYAKGRKGFVFSELTSEQHNSVALFETESIADPKLPNVHFASYKVVSANKHTAQRELDIFMNTKSGNNHHEGKKYCSLLERAKQEEEENKAEQERLQGSTLVYGDKIQLLHTASKKYLTVNTTEISRTETTNLRVELSSRNCEDCIFKILPRYKVRSVGDEVRYNDQIKFESLRTKGQYLHCSKCRFKSAFSVLERCFELNLSATESALMLIPHYRPMPSHDPKSLRGGGVVRLFHYENECYVSAEGSFAESGDIMENEPLVHCRKRPSKFGYLKHPSTSANVYWQFEKESDGRSGEPLSWGERCRIKHLPTRCYLAVVQDCGKYKVILKERSVFCTVSLGEAYSDLETVFSLSPVIKEKDTILVESYARIKHLQTRTWLHLDKAPDVFHHQHAEGRVWCNMLHSNLNSAEFALQWSSDLCCTRPFLLHAGDEIHPVLQKVGTEFKRSSFNPDDPELEKPQWDGIKLFGLTATRIMNYDDAFTLELVADHLLDNFNFVAGIVPILSTHIRKYGGESPPPLDSRSAKLVQKALANLSDFLSTANERENKNRQKLLRNLKVLELIIKVLSLFKTGASEDSEQHNIFKGCYEVIKRYLRGNSRKNENYLARFMDFFKTQVGKGLNAEEVMIEMVEDNSAIVSEMVAEPEIDYMIEQLARSKDPRIMDFLGNLCVCEGRSISSSQNMFLHKLVYQQGKSQDHNFGDNSHWQNLLYTTAVGGSTQYPEGDKDVVYVCRPGKTDWSVLSDVMEQDTECTYLESQLNLFTRMCWGNNGTVIYALDKYDQQLVSFDEILLCVKNTTLKPSLRSKYVRLMSVMYVDIEDNRNVLENLSLLFVYDDSDENAQETVNKDTVALTGVENINFPSIRDWIKEHLECAAHKKVVASEKEENALLADIIQVLKLLVKYGYYDDYRDADELLQHLLEVLNGFTDLPFRSDMKLEEYDNEFTKTRRFKETEENKPIFDIKARILEIVDLFFNFQVYVRLQRFVRDFRLLESKRNYSREERLSTLEGLASKRTFELAIAQSMDPDPPADLSGLLSASLNLSCEEVGQQVTELTRERLRHIFSQSTFHFDKPDHFFENSHSERNLKLQDILIDLSQYDDPQLLQKSLHLLNRFYSSDVTLFEMAFQTQLLSAPKSCEIFRDVRKLLPTLHYHMNVDAGESGRAEIIKLLRRLTKLCHLEDADESHSQNQKMLFNSGLFSTVLTYVLRISKPDSLSLIRVGKKDGAKAKRQIRRQRSLSVFDDNDDKTVEAVCVECFKFLKALAKDHLQVQQRLYDVMDDLLDVDIGVASMAEVIAEIFIGEPELCLKVREDQIAKVFIRIAQKELPEGRPELFYALQAMAKVENLDLIVKKNQAFIVNHFSKMREQFCDHLLGEEKKDKSSILATPRKQQGSCSVKSKTKDSRMGLLIKAKPGDADLCLLLSVADLLASCCEGENPFIESVCQRIFSMDELFDIISCDFIVAERKRPFTRFLTSVYLTCTSGKYSLSLPMTKDLINSKMEDCLGSVSTYLSNFGKVVKTLPSSEKSLVRQGLSLRSRRHFSSQSSHPSEKTIQTPQSGSKSVPFITGEDGQLLPGVLLYFSDGLLPLLRAYYENFFHKSLLNRNKVTNDIVTALLEMARALIEHLTTDTQMKLYRGTVLTVLEKCGEELEIDDQIVMVFEKMTKDCKGYETLTKKLYKNTYATEIKLNETFNTYVKNFKLAHQGPNTALAQIGSKHTTCYSEEIEPLPLGLSFQRHVACFVDVHAKKQCDVVLPCVERLLAQLESSFHQLKDLKAEDRRKWNELDIKNLQIMRAIIHKEIVNIDPDLKDKDPVHYRKYCRSKVHPLQNSIQDMRNAVSRVLPLLSHPCEEMICEVLAFLKAMFYSGNRHVQEGINIVFDTREETIFKSMGSLLQCAAIMFNERQSFLGQAETRYEDEKILKHNPLAIINGKTHQPSSPDDHVIDIDVPIGTSGHAISSSTPLQEKDDTLNSFVEEREPQVSFKPKLHRQPAVTQNLELEVLESVSPPDYDEQKREAAADMVLHFQESRHVKLGLKVLGLMCDGQYRNMQNYLREQKDNLTSVNVVGEVAVFLQNFTLDINEETMDLVHLILQTLIEMCVGNYPNLYIIYHHQIIDALNHIFATKISNKKAKDAMRDCTIRDSIHLKGSAIELLVVMLERTDEYSGNLICALVTGLDIEALHHSLKEFYELMNDQKVKEMGYDNEARTGLFRTYHALVHITDYGVPSKKIEPKQTSDDEGDSDGKNSSMLGKSEGGGQHSSDDEELHQIWDFCKSRSKSVEVLYKNMNGQKILTRLHFPFDPHQELREEVIEKIKWNINHNSPEDKLRDLLKWMKAVKRDTLHSAQLHMFLPTKILTSHPTKRHILLVLWSILMSIFTLMAFEVPESLRVETLQWDFFNASGAIRPSFLSYWRGAYRPVLYTFGSVHLFLSIWMVLEYFIVNWPNFKLPRLWYSIVTRITKREAPAKLYTDVSVFGLRTIYVVVFLMCSILSLVFDGYFYCICLLHIIINNDILKRVLKSVTKNGKSLLWVAALGLVVLYIYAMVSFTFLHESFLAQESRSDLFCSTLYECLVSTIRYGLIENLELIVPITPVDFRVSAVRLIYDISFFIIVTTIGLNVVFGIIVDTFSELRDERFRAEQDQKSLCFICNIASHEFERRAGGFDHHIKHDHNMWEYIYLSIYLDQIDISDHNAIQKFVYDMIEKEKHDFFPLFHALVLEEEVDEKGKQIDELKSMVEKILKRFEEEEHQKTLHIKRQEQRKWEQQNLFQESFDARMSMYSSAQGHAGMLHPLMAFPEFRRSSYDRHSPSPQLPPSEELSSQSDADL